MASDQDIGSQHGNLMVLADAAITRQDEGVALAKSITKECQYLMRHWSQIPLYTYPPKDRDPNELIDEVLYICADRAIMIAADKLVESLSSEDLDTIQKLSNRQCFHAFCKLIMMICNGEIEHDGNQYHHDDWFAHVRDSGPWASTFREWFERPGSREHWESEVYAALKRIFEFAELYDKEAQRLLDEKNVVLWVEEMAAADTANVQPSLQSPSAQAPEFESLVSAPGPIVEPIGQQAITDDQADTSAVASRKRERQESPSDVMIMRSNVSLQTLTAPHPGNSPATREEKSITPASAAPTGASQIEATGVADVPEPASQQPTTSPAPAVRNNNEGGRNNSEKSLANSMLTDAQGMINPYGTCEHCKEQLANPKATAARLGYIPNGQCRIRKKRGFARLARCAGCTHAQAHTGILSCNIANAIERQYVKVNAVWSWRSNHAKVVQQRERGVRPLPPLPEPPASVSVEDRDRIIAEGQLDKGWKLLYKAVWDEALICCGGDEMKARRYTEDLPLLVTREELEAAVRNMPEFIQRTAARLTLEEVSLEGAGSGLASMSSSSSQASTFAQATTPMVIAGSESLSLSPPTRDEPAPTSRSGFTPINMHRHQVVEATMGSLDDLDKEQEEASPGDKRAHATTAEEKQPAQKKQRTE